MFLRTPPSGQEALQEPQDPTSPLSCPYRALLVPFHAQHPRRVNLRDTEVLALQETLLNGKSIFFFKEQEHTYISAHGGPEEQMMQEALVLIPVALPAGWIQAFPPRRYP